MFELVCAADYRVTEIDVMLHLCQKIDREDDDKARAAMAELHAVMRRHIDALTATLDDLARETAG
ncbi:hypothetical protein [Pleomorphomonas koreensis]|uniref:hypothetical protein n=1 Tax=Pleomorphomonas koreensis TaxID=257440 RepID=UPI0004229F60|nr:hypothetical protein [Pleomorphomonas koreensis]